jgi:hypothetical protein
MPYVAVHDPVFVPASAASFVQDGDFVIGVAKGKVAKAYHALDLQQHGSVDDEMPDGPIEVTWCSTCGTGAVFRAESQGAAPALRIRQHGERERGAQGRRDRQPLAAVHRRRRSTAPEREHAHLYDFVLTTWKEWRTRYPNTQVMKPMPGYLERFDLLRSRVARSRSGEGAAPDGSFSKDDRCVRANSWRASPSVTRRWRSRSPPSARHPSSTNASAGCPSS